MSQPTHGDVTLSAGGRLVYTPDDGFTGVDTFTYRASDGTASSAPATVTITVEEGGTTPGNRAPTAVADVYLTVDAGTPKRAAIRRCPSPAPNANRAEPTCSTPSRRRNKHIVGNNTCVTRHPPQRDRRGSTNT